MERDVCKRKKFARDRSQGRKAMELVLLCFLGVLGEHFGCSPGLAVDPLGWRGRGGRGPTGRTADSWAPQGSKGQKRVFCALFVPAGSAVADADHWWAAGLGCKTYYWPDNTTYSSALANAHRSNSVWFFLVDRHRAIAYLI